MNRFLQGHGLALTALSAGDAADFLAALGTPEESAEVTAHLTYPLTGDLAARPRSSGRRSTIMTDTPFAQRLAEHRRAGGHHLLLRDRPTPACLGDRAHLARPAALADLRQHGLEAAAARARLRQPGRRAGGLAHRHPQRQVTDRDRQAWARSARGCCATTGSEGTAPGGTRCSSRCSPTSGRRSAAGCWHAWTRALTRGIDGACGRRRLRP